MPKIRHVEHERLVYLPEGQQLRVGMIFELFGHGADGKPDEYMRAVELAAEGGRIVAFR